MGGRISGPGSRADLIHERFQTWVLADIRHDAEPDTEQPGEVGEDLPVADVAGDHHEALAACKGSFEVLLSLDDYPFPDFPIIHVGVPDGIHHDIAMVHEYPADNAGMVCISEGLAHLERGGFTVKRIEEIPCKAKESAQGDGGQVRHDADAPDHCLGYTVLYFLKEW